MLTPLVAEIIARSSAKRPPFPTAPFCVPHRPMPANLMTCLFRAFARAYTRERARRRTVNFGNFRLFAAALIATICAVPAAAEPVLLRPARVFDGVDPRPHAGWPVLVDGDRIAAAGPNLAAPAGARVIDLPGATLMPGMIEGHSHLFLHPYNETLWDDQVLHEPLALRTARAVVQAERTLDGRLHHRARPWHRRRGLSPTSASSRRSTRASSPARACSSQPRRSSRAAPMVPKASSRASSCRKARRRSAGVDETIRAVRDQVAAGADIINSMPTIIGARASRAAPPCHRPSSTPAPPRRMTPAAWSRFMRPPPRA